MSLSLSAMISVWPDLLSPDPILHFTGNMKVILKCTTFSLPIVALHMEGFNIRHLTGSVQNDGRSDQKFGLVYDLQKGTVRFLIHAA